MKQRVEFSASAVSSLSRMSRVDRKFVLEGIRTHLIDNDPLQVSQNKFPLRRPSAYAERELRLDPWRVFYSVLEDGALVVVNLIGEKHGNKLILAGEEFEL